MRIICGGRMGRSLRSLEQSRRERSYGKDEMRGLLASRRHDGGLSTRELVLAVAVTVGGCCCRYICEGSRSKRECGGMSVAGFCVRVGGVGDLAGVVALERRVVEAPHWAEGENE